MNGIDVSSWQPPDITGRVDFDFVIIKATEGTSYISPNCDKQYQIAKTREKCIGVYHFLKGGDPIAEANFFIDNIQGYLGEAILVLDWEANAINMGREWLRSVIKQVKDRTKISTIVIYGSLSPIQAHKIDKLAEDEGCLLWVAAYPNYNNTGYRDEPQLLDSLVRQYTSSGRLPGYNANIDLNISVLMPDQWREIAKGNYKQPAQLPLPIRKSNDQIASEVIQGQWGNGEDRRNRLTASGYSYSEIQNLVNMKLGTSVEPIHKTANSIAAEVIGGLWGNGNDRTNRLKAAGHDPKIIQNLVNLILGVSAEEAKAQPEYYTVPSGSAGYNGSTAAKFGLTVDQLVKMNKDKYPNMTANYVQAGWILRVK